MRRPRGKNSSGAIPELNDNKQKDESSESHSFTPKRSGFANNQNSHKNPKSLNVELDPLGKDQIKSMAPSHPTNYRLDHRKLKIEDLEDDSAEIIFKALDDVKEIKDTIIIEKAMIEETINLMKSDFDKEKQVLNAKFKSTKVYLQKYVENIQKDLEEELIKRNREKANFNLKLNKLDSKVDDLGQLFKNNDHVSEGLAETVNLLVQTALINHSMELQDEVDREKLALMGYKEETQDFKTATMKSRTKKIDNFNSYVALDKQCLTCSGQSSVVMKAFKIACLAYKPSPVVYPENDMKSHSRIDLIHLKGKMLKHLEVIPLTKEMREEGRDPISERTKLFNQYLHFANSKAQQKDSMINSLFHARQPKITIRSEAMSSSDLAHPGSPLEMQQKLGRNYEGMTLLNKNVTMLSDKTEALSRNPFNEKGVKKIKKRGSSKDFFGPQTMSLPKIKTARIKKPDSFNH